MTTDQHDVGSVLLTLVQHHEEGSNSISATTVTLASVTQALQQAPTLSDLNQEQLQQIAKIVLTQRLTNQLHTAVNLAGIDYEDEKKIFINNVGHESSRHTRDGYRRGIQQNTSARFLRQPAYGVIFE